jgi:hypothetical protein
MNPVYGKIPVRRGSSQSRDVTVDLVYYLLVVVARGFALGYIF